MIKSERQGVKMKKMRTWLLGLWCGMLVILPPLDTTHWQLRHIFVRNAVIVSSLPLAFAAAHAECNMGPGV